MRSEMWDSKLQGIMFNLTSHIAHLLAKISDFFAVCCPLLSARWAVPSWNDRLRLTAYCSLVF
jgi:hypothetical protein